MNVVSQPIEYFYHSKVAYDSDFPQHDEYEHVLTNKPTLCMRFMNYTSKYRLPFLIPMDSFHP